MKTILTMLVLTGTLLLGACGPKETPKQGEGAEPAATPAGAAETNFAAGGPAMSGPREINVYMYSDYIAPELLEKFKNQSGITVRISPYETTEEMLAKMQTGGGMSEFDIVVVSDHAVPVMASLNLIKPIEAKRVPNLKNVDKRFQNPPYDPLGNMSVPYQWGTMGIMYRKDRVPNIDPSWALFFEPAKQPGPFVLIDSMRDMLGGALLYEGKSINSQNAEELKRAGELTLLAKKSPRCLGFEGGVGGKNKVASGEATMAIVYNGDAVRAIDEDKSGNLGYVLPKEGSEIWVDAMVLTKLASDVDAAHQFINFIMDPQVGAELSNFNRYATPNTAAMQFITEADRNNPAIYPPAEQLDKLRYLEDVGAATQLYDQVWTTVKSR